MSSKVSKSIRIFCFLFQEEAKALNRQQFNSPLGLYSEEKIAETLTSQAEVLAQGVLG